jgi:hypothetical protein
MSDKAEEQAGAADHSGGSMCNTDTMILTGRAVDQLAFTT